MKKALKTGVQMTENLINHQIGGKVVTKTLEKEQSTRFKSNTSHLYIMGRKRTNRGLWVLLLSALGTAIIIFSKNLATIPVFDYLSSGMYVVLGIVLIIRALVIGLTR